MSSYYEKNKDQILKRLNDKYRSDSEFKEKVKAENKRRYHTDLEYKEKTIQRAKDRNTKKKDSN
ncbi:MAG: hypothetical protein GW809_00915 [Bacteroidetes bacterium]|nr:hypothetical protein [Bacteroidota bacterium]NCQ10725.1 hypothetical protein [Bacteroidota bacterium]